LIRLIKLCEKSKLYSISIHTYLNFCVSDLSRDIERKGKQIELRGQILRKFPNINCHKNSSIGNRIISLVQRGGEMDRMI
jgi:hypothetical protein